ncbi:hypothetical protein CPLU01_10923 [Colletotrichum plurivorum]|uniref:Uncharacterized protein n=1 Tax=Colletotrichum plurivorum TaxID=2175906 RepID=A0A8H6K3R5_9PEZI|nr:hypothetical protein CPLU01_10923 [Colletotrichum plurivorum]
MLGPLRPHLRPSRRVVSRGRGQGAPAQIREHRSEAVGRSLLTTTTTTTDQGGRRAGEMALKQEARTLQGGRGCDGAMGPEDIRDETIRGKQLAWTATAAVASGAMRGEGNHSAIGYEDPSLVGETASRPVSGKSRRAQEASSGP